MIKLPISKGKLLLALRIALLTGTLALCAAAQHNPVILVPGLTGSELRNKDTNERVWFRPFKPKDDDLRLPLNADPTLMGDKLIATDALRDIRVAGFSVVDAYGGFIRAMIARGGYHEEKWDAPGDRGADMALYVYAYDWRLDNVGNARVLVQKVEALRKKLGKPDLKFDIVAHSMGGLVSRYAAMYGDVDLPAAGKKPQPTWAGAKYFDKVVLIGTPNEGAVNALNSLINGFTFNGVRVDLPFVQDTSKFTVFTIPAAYQLMPAPGTLRAFDETLEPIEVDIYDSKTWRKYGWDVTRDNDFTEEFDAPDRRVADAYFAAALSRAKRLHEALAAADGKASGVSFYTVGGDCRAETPDGLVLYFDKQADKWRTQFRPKGFTRWDGYRFSDADIRKAVLSPGDGIVPLHSIEASFESKRAGVTSIIGSEAVEKVCEDHNRQAANTGIQDYVIKVLTGKTVAPKQLATTAH
jgi:pimeloyl-ACP methyl ester carboxylesterase